MNRLRLLVLMVGFVAVAAVQLAPRAVLAQSDNWNALFDRIIRLEHEIKAIKSSGAGAGGAAAQGDQGYRLTAIEDQLRRLLGGMEQLQGQMREMQGRIKRLEQRKSGKAPTQKKKKKVTYVDPLPSFSASTFEPYDQDTEELDLTVLPEGSEESVEYQAQFESVPQSQVLGQIVVDPDTGLAGQGYSDQGEVSSSLLPGSVETAALDDPTSSAGTGGTSGTSSGGAKGGLYERSYKNLLGRRFGLAEAGFITFINKNPKHPSASKAQYWLGETYYVQGRYKQAAQSFLTGYKTYPKGARAPESLLKLGMSLKKLGQKKQACGVFAEVRRSYPSAGNAKKMAVRESKRAGC